MTIIQFSWIWIGIALFTFVALVVFKIKAPYGRHSSSGWGPMIANKWGWFLMELPALLIMPLVAILGPNRSNPLALLLIGLWFFHYFYRTLIFPFQLRTKDKKMPLAITFSAIFFNGMNGFINGYALAFLPLSGSMNDWNVFLGVLIFLGGMLMNRGADRYLIGLREQNTGYQIPRSPLFKWVSCPNHLGEIIEWSGFALIAWSVPALSFAVWTFCNLAPRSLNHHEWYLQKFEDYPKERKALIPFIL